MRINDHVFSMLAREKKSVNLPVRRFKDENMQELLSHFKEHYFGKARKDVPVKKTSVIEQDKEQIL